MNHFGSAILGMLEFRGFAVHVWEFKSNEKWSRKDMKRNLTNANQNYLCFSNIGASNTTKFDFKVMHKRNEETS